MTDPILNVEVAPEDEAASLLARQFYLHFHKYKKSEPRPAPFVPEWCLDYADKAVRYLADVDLQDAIDDLREDYR
jgi:hypothetical protein